MNRITILFLSGIISAIVAISFVLYDNNDSSKHNFTAEVEMYSYATCPYCIKAKKLLDRKGVKYKEYDVKLDRAQYLIMSARSNGGTTVPQIFINGTHIGGYTDLQALDSSGKLNELLK